MAGPSVRKAEVKPWISSKWKMRNDKWKMTNNALTTVSYGTPHPTNGFTVCE